MINAYLVAFPAVVEGEDLEIKFAVTKDDQVIMDETLYLEYAKPSVVGVHSVISLLGKLGKYKYEAITVYIKDDALYEIIRGTSTTKKGEVLKAASKLKKELSKYETMTFVNISNKDKETLQTWKDHLGIMLEA